MVKKSLAQLGFTHISKPGFRVPPDPSLVDIVFLVPNCKIASLLYHISRDSRLKKHHYIYYKILFDIIVRTNNLFYM